ncbi:MAG: hypothetical protein PHG07_08470 [Lachnospiraceae bacterium]|nr:hypothetical protein [Lachnospiraceae bacterium]
MFVKHICSGLLVVYPIWRDIKEQKIYIFPAVGLAVLGILADVFCGEIALKGWLEGLLPGCACFLLGRWGRGCIGDGDSLLILIIGVLEGVKFCLSMLIVSGMGILIFSIGALVSGRLHRKSTVPFVPFLAIGYIGAWLM